MKIFFLMLLITDANGNENLQRVSDVAYKSMFECKVEQMKHRNDELMKFYCVDSHNVIKK